MQGPVLPRARGGNVAKGRAYLVGEDSPELFIPSTSGQVAPITAGADAGGGMAVNINITALDTAGAVKVLHDNRGVIVGLVQQAYNRRGQRGPMG